MSEVTISYLHVENNIVTNSVLGTSTYFLENWIENKYPVDVTIGWKYIPEKNIFLPPNVTEEDLQEQLHDHLVKLKEAQAFYYTFTQSNHYKNGITEELKTSVLDYLKNIAEIIKDVEEKTKKNIMHFLGSECHQIPTEPFIDRPNLENEV
jgi:hypothetical protein